jgi:hypothetical protein
MLNRMAALTMGAEAWADNPKLSQGPKMSDGLRGSVRRSSAIAALPSRYDDNKYSGWPLEQDRFGLENYRALARDLCSHREAYTLHG